MHKIFTIPRLTYCIPFHLPAGDRNSMETICTTTIERYHDGMITREERTCQSGHLPDIVINFWTDRADHDIQLVSNSAGTFSACPDTPLLF